MDATIKDQSLTNKRNTYILYGILAILCYFIFLHRLGTYPIKTWDESIYAVGSYEMHVKNNYWYPTIHYHIDTFNDKPPFYMWMQIISIRLLGFNEFSVRLPSALFGILTVLLIFNFIRKKFSLIQGFVSALILLTAQGFSNVHSGRYGDMDTTFSFAVLGMCIHLYSYISDGLNKHIWFYFIYVAIALFTKSLMIAFILVPQSLIILIFCRNILLKPTFWLSLLLILGLFSWYVYYRNSIDNFYFKNTILNYFTNYNNAANVAQDQNFIYYFNNLIFQRFSFFILLFFPAVYIAFKETNKDLKYLVFVFSIAILGYFVLISISSSKCFWYDLPLMPLLSVVIGYILNVIFEKYIIDFKSLIICVSFSFMVPVYITLDRVLKIDCDTYGGGPEVVSDYLGSFGENMKESKIQVINESFETPLLFYQYKLKKQNKEVIITDIRYLRRDAPVIVYLNSNKEYISKNYQFEIVGTYKEATIYKIK